MAKHSKHRLGCDCLNSMNDIGETGNPGLCDACDDPYRRALCAYVAMFECSYYTQDARMEKVTEPCLVLRKDCIVGCTYSSRWCCSTSNPSTDTPYLQKEDCDLIVNRPAGNCPFCRTQCYAALITAATFPDACPVTALALSDAIAAGGLLINMPLTGAAANGCRWFGRRCPFGCYPGSDYINLTLEVDENGDWTFTVQYPTGDCTFGASALYYATYSFPLDPFNCDTPGELVLTDGSFTITVTLTASTCTPDGNGEINMEDCSWAQDPCTCADACTNGPEATGSADEYADSTDTCYTKWRMDISSAPVATIVGVTRNGETITYRTSNFACYEETTFTLSAGDYDPVFIGLPRCLCVRPVDYRPEGCADSGLDACCDSGGPTLNIKLSIYNCNNELVLNNEWVPFTRGFSPLPCGVNNPFPNDPCLYFATQVTVEEDCPDWGGDLFIVMYCSTGPTAPAGTPPCGYPDSETRYNFEWYCLNVDTGCWEARGSECASYVCGCLGPAPPELTITKDCCCDVIECGDCLVPTTLYLTLGGTCTGLSGATATLTYTGGAWQGTLTGATCGCESVNDVTLTCEEGGAFSLIVNQTDASCDQSAEAGWADFPVSCATVGDPTEVFLLEFEWADISFANGGCDCDLDGGDTVTATITE